MYKCNECDAEFEVGKIETEMHRELDAVWFEEYQVCPECGKQNFESVVACKCGEAYIKDTQEFCDDCYSDVSAFANRLSEMRGLSWKDTVDLIASWGEWN